MDRETRSVHRSHMLNSKVRPIPKPSARQKIFLKEWRQFRGLTQEKLAERIGVVHTTIGRVERGVQSYTQDLLEACAAELGTDVASIIMRNPADPEGIWSVWDGLKPLQKRQAVQVLKALVSDDEKSDGGDRGPPRRKRVA
jgi:transcriptional regulator with XRE-family HTH domain